jgi:hypothetical protein
MGHDRETYEHSQNLGKVLLSQSAVIPSADGQTLFLFRLGGLLDSEEKVGEIAGLQDTPRVVVGSSEMESKARFCLVDEKAKRKIEEWLARVGKGKDI